MFVITRTVFLGSCPQAAVNIAMGVRRKDPDTSLASVAGEVEMEEEGNGARLFQNKASEMISLGFDRLRRLRDTTNMHTIGAFRK